MVKVSIVVPVYNVKRYLCQCLDSIVNQTLKDIEIICVDDGSNDGSEKILDEYASKDSRIRVIHKENSGYGHSMNVGFAAATGEYIGIIESDDYAELNMFESLYDIAYANNLDVIKSGFFYYYSVPTERNEKREIVSHVLANKTFCPTSFFESNMEMVEFFNIKPTIWSAIYKREFINSNEIKFLETPGASYQDAGFNFKVMAKAQKVQLIREAYVHYRQDSIGSSINSKGKVFCVCDEYEEMERFLKDNPLLYGRLIYIMQRIKFDSYMWNYERLGDDYKYIFIEKAAAEFREGLVDGTIDKKYFEWYKWELLNKIADNPIKFYTERCLIDSVEYNYWKSEYFRIRNSYTYKIGNVITILPRCIRKTIKCIKKHGLRYTFTISLNEFMKGKTFEK